MLSSSSFSFQHEFSAGHGSVINVDYQDDGSCRVEDFGQGFPVNVTREDGETVLQASFDVLNTSGKFSDDGVYEGTALGLNGIGSKLANFLSSRLVVTTYRDGKSERILFIDGIFLVNKENSILVLLLNGNQVQNFLLILKLI